jgi:threonyl-tRNA synthetase
MKVLLPDNRELELPAGATGLDAARAIGPKLAEQAVLVRANGACRISARRSPTATGSSSSRRATRTIPTRSPSFVTPPRTCSPRPCGALSGREDRDRPADRERLLLRLRLSGADPRGGPREDRAEIRRELEGGREWSREEISRDDARSAFAAEAEPYKVELVDTAEGDISLYTQGDFTISAAARTCQNSKPIKASSSRHLAGAYWRGDSAAAADADLRHGLLSQADLDAYLERMEQARARDHRPHRPAARPLPHVRVLAGAALWTAKGMAIYNALEDLRRRENAKRGYSEVKTPLMWDVELWKRSGHWEKYGTTSSASSTASRSTGSSR